jgi:hypothetical protein
MVDDPAVQGYGEVVVRINENGTYTTVGRYTGLFPSPPVAVNDDGRIFVPIRQLVTDDAGVSKFVAKVAVLNPDNTTMYIPVDVDGFYDERAVLPDGRILLQTWKNTESGSDEYSIQIVNPDNSVDVVDLDSRLVEFMTVGGDGRAYALRRSYLGNQYVTEVHIVDTDNSVNVVPVTGYSYTPAITPDGHFLLPVSAIESGQSVGKLLVFNPDGTYTAVRLAGQPNGGVAVGDDGRVYVFEVIQQSDGKWTYLNQVITIADPAPTVV